jgi:hypothetical protein
MKFPSDIVQRVQRVVWKGHGGLSTIAHDVLDALTPDDLERALVCAEIARCHPVAELEADVRDQALEEAAKACGNYVCAAALEGRECHHDSCATAQNCARRCRALKSKPEKAR